MLLWVGGAVTKASGIEFYYYVFCSQGHWWHRISLVPQVGRSLRYDDGKLQKIAVLFLGAGKAGDIEFHLTSWVGGGL